MAASLASLAAQMDLTPVEAISLPTVVEVASRKASMAQSRMVWLAQTDKALRDYLAGICRSTMAGTAL